MYLLTPPPYWPDIPHCQGETSCATFEGILRCLWLQDVAAKQRESEGRDPHIAQRLQKKVTKRAQFLENVASSKRQASLAVQGVLKKKRKKDRVGKRLGDLSQLADSLREAAQLVSSAPSFSKAGVFLHVPHRCLCSYVALLPSHAHHKHALM